MMYLIVWIGGGNLANEVYSVWTDEAKANDELKRLKVADAKHAYGYKVIPVAPNTEREESLFVED